MTISTSGVCQRTKWGWCSPLRCGQHYSTTATWAAYAIYSLTDRVRMSGAWPRSRRLPGSSPPAPRSLPNSVWVTPAKTTVSVERAGTATCVTAPGLDTLDDPVKEVRLSFCHIAYAAVWKHVISVSWICPCVDDAARWHTSPCIVLSEAWDYTNVNIIDIKDNQKKKDCNYLHYSFRILCLKGTSFQVQVEQHHQTKACRWSFYPGWWLNISSSQTANLKAI